MTAVQYAGRKWKTTHTFILKSYTQFKYLVQVVAKWKIVCIQKLPWPLIKWFRKKRISQIYAFWLGDSEISIVISQSKCSNLGNQFGKLVFTKLIDRWFSPYTLKGISFRSTLFIDLLQNLLLDLEFCLPTILI